MKITFSTEEYTWNFHWDHGRLYLIQELSPSSLPQDLLKWEFYPCFGQLLVRGAPKSFLIGINCIGTIKYPLILHFSQVWAPHHRYSLHILIIFYISSPKMGILPLFRQLLVRGAPKSFLIGLNCIGTIKYSLLLHFSEVWEIQHHYFVFIMAFNVDFFL